jgi:hypothetical protein
MGTIINAPAVVPVVRSVIVVVYPRTVIGRIRVGIVAVSVTGGIVRIIGKWQSDTDIKENSGLRLRRRGHEKTGCDKGDQQKPFHFSSFSI